MLPLTLEVPPKKPKESPVTKLNTIMTNQRESVEI
jgi:hypothetical protein